MKTNEGHSHFHTIITTTSEWNRKHHERRCMVPSVLMCIAAKHNSRACTTHIYTLPSYRTRPPYDTICQNKWAQHDSNCDASVCVCFLYNACIFCISLTLTGIHTTLTADEKCLLVCVCVCGVFWCLSVFVPKIYRVYKYIYTFLTVRVHHTKTFVMF